MTTIYNANPHPVVEINSVERRSGNTVPAELPLVGLVAADGSPGGQVGGFATLATASFTRPANTTPYDAGDLVANNTTAASVAPMTFTVARTAGGTGMIRRARIRKTGTGTTGASFRLHLYRTAPATITNGDNGAWSTSGSADYIGAIDVTIDRAFTDGTAGNGVPLSGSEINFDLPSGTTIRGLLEARGAYTPISGEVFTVDLEVLQN